MRHVLKIFSFLLVLTVQVVAVGQVTSVNFALEQKANTSTYDCFLVVGAGSAIDVQHRIQFNAQISFVVATGALVEFLEFHAPLSGVNYSLENKPLIWELTSRVISPSVSPDFDYYGVTPSLGRVALYGELNQGDKIKLFSMKVSHHEKVDGLVRIFDSNKDLTHKTDGMLGADFSNGFTLGGTDQIYRGVGNSDNVDRQAGAGKKE